MAETEISEIENLVSAILSEKERDETRYKLYINLISEREGNINFPEQYVNEMIEYCIRRIEEIGSSEGYNYRDHSFMQIDISRYAARIANNAGRTKLAQQICEEAIDFVGRDTLDAMVIAGDASRDGIPGMDKVFNEMAFSYCEGKRDFELAAIFAEELGMPEKAEAYQALKKKQEN